MTFNHSSWEWHRDKLDQALFLTPAAEKTKTQARNSSQKLKEKTQPQGGTFLLLRKTPEKNSILPIYLLKLKFSYGVTTFSDIFITENYKILPISSILPKNTEFLKKIENKN